MCGAGTWMWRAALCCVLLGNLLPPARGLNMCMSGSATSCEECLLIHPSCAWCAQEDFGRGRTLTSRCDFSQNLQKRGCEAPFIEYLASSTSVLENRPLSSKGSGSTQYDVVQIMPQKISLSLRPGDQTWFGVQVRQVEDYPVDLYYLMDLSLSMKDDLDTIRNLGTKLALEMGKLTSNFRLGFGSFVDKNMSPFSYTAPKYQENPCSGYKLFPKCVPTFGFRHILSLTDKVDRFNEEVQKQMVSRNRDAPEGGFDAILQAAVCKEKIGWRKEAYHLLVFATDDVPHLALDGRLGGLVQPHDGQCHLNDLNEYSASTKMDYPSLALLGEKLAENNIFLIFAVTKRLYVIYKNFTALIPGTTVEILDQDSKNVIQLIIAAYNNIRSKVELTVWDHPEDISLSFTATCQDGKPLPGLRKCADLKIGDTLDRNADGKATTPSLTPKLYEKLFPSRILHVKGKWAILEKACFSYCCCCDFTALAGCSPATSGDGCSHQEAKTAEMQRHLLAPSRLVGCRFTEPAHTEPTASGPRGNICRFLQNCIDLESLTAALTLFSQKGHGECHCGECKCHAGYVGDNCNCSTETASCVADDGQMCSGRGHCACGRCQCTEPGAFGVTCEKCPTCPDACGTKRECIECRLFNSGRLADNQTCQRLCKDEIITVESFNADDPGAVLCLYKTNDDCVMKFTYSEHASGQSILTALQEPECGGGPDAMTVLLAVVGSILLVGMVLLAVWKLVITVHDRREFARFQSARSRARYEMASNPLYKQPVSTHFVETDFNMYGKSYNGGVH
ncbi:itgb5 wu:fi30h12 [Scophthalmus maximus]|uniref:Integrin beta n=1 Tax=Scophthalmus maximus TaxID=52904 RepID=A0A2U9CFH9_SCOMX|nr:itgb5 wu:fi30h12 [Scophthalmus maximus]